MDGPFRNPFTVLVGELFEQVVILHQKRATGTGGERVLIVGDGSTGRGGHDIGRGIHSVLVSMHREDHSENHC